MAHKKVCADDVALGDHCSVREAAEYAGCSEFTIRRWVREGLLEASRAFDRGSSRLRISVASLQKLVGGASR